MEIGERHGDALDPVLFMRGTLEVPNCAPMDCVVIDISDTGARVALADWPHMGDHAKLIVSARNFSRECDVVQHGCDDTFGLAFTEAV
jgi:hypothetical protein